MGAVSPKDGQGIHQVKVEARRPTVNAPDQLPTTRGALTQGNRQLANAGMKTMLEGL